MKINEETILKLASLSKLKFEKKEMDLITNDMQKMIDFIQTLEEINTDGVKPLSHMTEGYNNINNNNNNIHFFTAARG